MPQKEPKPRKTRPTTAGGTGRCAFADYLSRVRQVYQKKGVEPELKPGATGKQIATLEARLGFPVSPDLAQAWTVANGSDTPIFARPGFYTGYRLVSTVESLAEQRAISKRASTYGECEQEEPRDARIRPGWFNEGWVPFGEFGGGSLLLIEDHAPTETGQPGQIIGFVHDPDEIGYVTESFAKLLTQSIKALEAEPYEFGISADAIG